MRTYEIHELRLEFVLLLLVNARPAITLRSRDRAELAEIGQAWVNAVCDTRKAETAK